MKLLRALLLVISLSLGSLGVAHAQAAQPVAQASVAIAATAAAPSVQLTWVAPTTNTDGTAITGAISYNLFQGTGASASSCVVGTTPVQSGLSSTSVTVTAGLTDGTTACFAVTAVVGGQMSADSNVADKTFPAATPMAPTNLVAS